MHALIDDRQIPLNGIVHLGDMVADCNIELDQKVCLTYFYLTYYGACCRIYSLSLKDIG
jgi:hypothetical protein